MTSDIYQSPQTPYKVNYDWVKFRSRKGQGILALCLSNAIQQSDLP